MKPLGRVGADPTLVSSANWERWAKKLAENSIYLLPIRSNLVDIVWGNDKPLYSKHDAYVWPMEYAGEFYRKFTSLLNSLPFLYIIISNA